ncbi:MAG: hypothetical protein KDC07_06880 [Chitinophagaceae bacterium]|nr:hypothetical protein [Chitinophagaceae bacterium]MCB9047023.1 hypothetical protein [Chitinophagales bacterium]
MKYLMGCVMLLLCSSTTITACDVCGCSSGNQNLGLLPQMYRHFVGVQYQFNSFTSTHIPLSDTKPVEYSNEYYRNMQLWGRLYIGKKWQFFGFLPYRYNTSTYTAYSVPSKGLGDATLLANYTFYLTPDSSTSPVRQRLQGGAGIKAPTGSYVGVTQLEREGLPNMQAGTGSWDIPINANYTLRYKQAGINADASFNLTTANKDNYKYGNRFTAQLTGFYWIQKNKLSLLPQAGARYEYALHDYDNYNRKWLNKQTGGYIVSCTAGVQAYYNSIGLQLQYSKPLAQVYGGGYIKALQRIDVGIMLLF